MLGWLRRGHEQPAGTPAGLAVATQQANRAHDRERELRQHQQRRDGWLEANAHLGPQYRQVVRALAWQRRASGLAVEQERPAHVLQALGAVPESTRGRRAWRQAAGEIEYYRHTYGINDPDWALGPEPNNRVQWADRQRARTAIERLQAKQHALQAENARLERERQRLKDPAYVEALAKRDLQMVQPGEQAWVLAGQPPADRPAAAAPGPTPPASKQAWYRRAWQWLVDKVT